MYRSFAVILFAVTAVVAATPISLDAQGRGHRLGRAGGTAPSAQAGPEFVGRVSRLPPRIFRGPAPVFAARGPLAAPVVRNPSVRFVGQRTIFVPQQSVYYSQFLSAAPILTTPMYSAPAYSAAPLEPTVTQNEMDLAYELRRLSREIEQLRKQQALPLSQQAPPQVQSITPPRPAVTTVLVFRDGHRLEIQNWVIAGQTLWVVDETASTKISISDLDLDATQKENRDRGVRFPLLAK